LAEETRERPALRRELRSRLGQLGVSLQLLAEGVLGEEDEPIDWVATLPDGRVVVGLLALGGADGGLLARGLGQRAWVQARLPDWQQLAPGLVVRSEARPFLFLLATEFSRGIRIAVREADAEGIRMVRYAWRSGRRGPELGLEAVEAPPPPYSAVAPPPRLVSTFRSGLSERDFELRPGEGGSGRP
jgi:hypothetical protein